jgi:transcriptional regulator with XRE-family HTH domain
MDKTKTQAMRFAHRLRSTMQAAGLKISPTSLAHEFNLRYWGKGITVTAASNWLNGVSVPKMDKLITLASVLQVSPQALLFDEPSASESVSPLMVAQHAPHLENVSLPDMSALLAYRRLSKEHQRMVREVVQGLSCMLAATTAQLEHEKDTI